MYHVSLDKDAWSHWDGDCETRDLRGSREEKENQSTVVPCAATDTIQGAAGTS